MRKVLAMALVGALCVVVNVGCNNKDKEGGPSTQPIKASDGCSHCAGVQTLKADGTCPQCGMKPQK